jgi:hypothetical protein
MNGPPADPPRESRPAPTPRPWRWWAALTLGGATLALGVVLLVLSLNYQVIHTNYDDALLQVIPSIEFIAVGLLLMGLTMTCLAVLVNPRRLL